MTFRIIKNNKEDLSILKKFLDDLSDSTLKYFKYFTRRDISIINQHILTVLIMENERPICYGHLDKENDIIWLGICVAQDKFGFGYGRYMMEYLMRYAEDNNIEEIALTVSPTNFSAISLFKKFNFKIVEISNTYYKMIKHIK